MVERVPKPKLVLASVTFVAPVPPLAIATVPLTFVAVVALVAVEAFPEILMPAEVPPALKLFKIASSFVKRSKILSTFVLVTPFALLIFTKSSSVLLFSISEFTEKPTARILKSAAISSPAA
jgi:hypothetical protein